MDQQAQAMVEAIELLGGPAAVGRLFSPAISSQAVSQWRRVPVQRVMALEAATAAAGSVVSRHRLRPDVFGAAPLAAHHDVSSAQASHA